MGRYDPCDFLSIPPRAIDRVPTGSNKTCNRLHSLPLIDIVLVYSIVDLNRATWEKGRYRYGYRDAANRAAWGQNIVFIDGREGGAGGLGLYKRPKDTVESRRAWQNGVLPGTAGGCMPAPNRLF